MIYDSGNVKAHWGFELRAPGKSTVKLAGARLGVVGALVAVLGLRRMQRLQFRNV